ncbi:MAG: nitrite reductase (NAD(P)H) small subunit [Deltaproteobacteria bacterium]|nr:nitrite reductase (NAD(P)H) small subunit [Deltaproteobacteria bacterium]
MERTGIESEFTIVVAGNGMVGHRFCERLAELRQESPMRVVVFGEETRAAYDRVRLSAFFTGCDADDLALTDPSWYAAQGFELHLGDGVSELDRGERVVSSAKGLRLEYDALVLATGSESFVPPIPGIETEGVFAYRTLEDLEGIAEWAERSETTNAAVIGGGLLGLEAAKAAVDMGLETHVIEFADRLMPRQLDEEGAALLSHAIESLGVHVHTGIRTEAVLGKSCVTGMRFADGAELDVDIVLVSAGIRPRDELARESGIEVGERGGIVVDDTLATSDPHVFAIGECARHRGTVYGLVGPGYAMADVLARRFDRQEVSFSGADLSAKLKLMGVDVASFGDPFADADGVAARRVVIEDRVAGVYQKLVVTADGERLLGGILVGDAEPYARLLRTLREHAPVPPRPHQLLTGVPDASSDAGSLSNDALICSCSNVSKGDIVAAIQEHELSSIAELKSCTKAGSGCGGCMPLVTQIFEAEQACSGREASRSLCEHFDHTREELFQIVKLGRIRSFDALLSSHGKGNGCEICRPTVASILASTWNELVTDHATIQDTNDRYLANIQRGGSYSVVPRVPGGEITPQKLAVLARVAEDYDLYCKFTGGQRIDLFGASVDQLPAIWEQLVAAGFESGHAYGKSMRTVKSCVGSTWCRFGVGDSTSFAIRVEQRYRGLRGPHKIKGAVSGCIRECAEAQNKDFGIIATKKGWNLYLCGNGGSNPRHGDLFATDLDDDTVLHYIDRFLMFYIQTARPLQRTARWLEALKGGIEYLKSVVIDDVLGVCEQLEIDMQRWVDSYRCEWAQVVGDPERRAWFRHYASSRDTDESLEFMRHRGQKRPADSPGIEGGAGLPALPPEQDWTWTALGRAEDLPIDGGQSVRYGTTQLAVFRFESRGEWYATQNTCPQRGENVMARGLLGSQDGEPKIACPVHKRTFSLITGKGLSDPAFRIGTFPVRISEGEIYVKLPSPQTLSNGIRGNGQVGSG